MTILEVELPVNPPVRASSVTNMIACRRSVIPGRRGLDSTTEAERGNHTQKDRGVQTLCIFSLCMNFHDDFSQRVSLGTLMLSSGHLPSFSVPRSSHKFL
jgi:hypothetical protein